ncbi:MAG: Holliday junction resolvase RuvX [Alphaproteobacteria bacterium]|nr:Holliday junction resolvase RuvX [Alphaproteobacteria bacterium]
MTIGLLKDIIGEMPRDVRLLGMDVGKKTIGLAVSDPDLRVATPVKTLQRVKFSRDIEEIRKIIKDYEIGGFIIGLPLNMDGSEGRACQSVRDFAAEMENALTRLSALGTLSLKGEGGAPRSGEGEGLWIALWDERLSTASVEDFVDNSVGIKKRKAKEQGLTDKLAAQYILQGALDYLHKSL